MCTEDFELVSVLTAVDGAAAYRGASAWTKYFAAIEQMWQDCHVEDLRVFEAGGRAAAIFQIVGTAKQSGVRIGQGVGITYEFRNGKFSRMES
jgi:ketosteroid isomerase-like protein